METVCSGHCHSKFKSHPQMIWHGNSLVEILGLIDYYLISMYHLISQTLLSTTKDNVFILVLDVD